MGAAYVAEPIVGGCGLEVDACRVGCAVECAPSQPGFGGRSTRRRSSHTRLGIVRAPAVAAAGLVEGPADGLHIDGGVAVYR
jgi:hypothetical protein